MKIHKLKKQPNIFSLKSICHDVYFSLTWREIMTYFEKSFMYMYMKYVICIAYIALLCNINEVWYCEQAYFVMITLGGIL